jgi:hypothetical protein
LSGLEIDILKIERKGVVLFMKKLFLLFLLFAAAVGTGAAASETPLGVEEIASVDELAAGILSYFPRVQGEVKAVHGDRLTISLGTKNGIAPGVMLTLWRDSREILHPVTGQVIGRTEDEVGDAAVTEVMDTTCTAVMRKRLKDPKEGDKARITPKKISMALLPLRADRPETLQGLAERLNESGRVSLLESATVTGFLKDRKERDRSLIKEMGKAYNLDIVAAVGIYPSEGTKLLVTVRLFYADEARQIDTIVAMLNLKSRKEAIAEVTPFFAPVTEEKNDIPELPFDAQLMAAADFEGSGALQYAFSDGVRLHVYRQGPAGWREDWVEHVPAGAGEIQHINLDAADINGNGRSELFVTAMRNGKVVSRVFEFQDGVYHQIAEIPGFLRVIAYPGKGTMLIGRGYDPVSFFSGPARQYLWSDGAYIAGADLSLPPGVGLYGFALASLGEPAPLLVALDDKDRLLVYSGETMIWKSEESYPFVGTSVIRPATGIEAVLSRETAEANKALKVRIPGRVLALDLNGDGKDEILLPKNSGGTYLRGHTRAEFVSLGWTGARLEQRWTIKDIAGAVLDFQILRLEGPGARIVALVRSPGGLFAGDTIKVMSYPAK